MDNPEPPKLKPLRAPTDPHILYLEIGWQTAMYLSADMTVRKMELVNWLMEVVVRYALHTAVPKIQSP